MSLLIPTFDPMPRLETERLILREWRISDVSEVYVLRSDPTVLKYLDRPPAKSLEDALNHINMILDGVTKGQWINWMITLKSEDKCIGDIGFWNYHDTLPQAEIGYQLHPDFHGKGIMSEAMKYIMKFGFKTMGLTKVTAHVHNENKKSSELLKRFNFRHDTTMVDEKEPYMMTWSCHPPEDR